LQHFVHGRAGIFQFRLNFIQDILGVHFDVALFVIALASDKQQIPVGHRAVE